MKKVEIEITGKRGYDYDIKMDTYEVILNGNSIYMLFDGEPTEDEVRDSIDYARIVTRSGDSDFSEMPLEDVEHLEQYYAKVVKFADKKPR